MNKIYLNNMTLTATSILIILLTLIIPSCERDTENTPDDKNKVGEPAPDFSLPDADGTLVSLNDYKNKNIVVLDFYRGYF